MHCVVSRGLARSSKIGHGIAGCSRRLAVQCVSDRRPGFWLCECHDLALHDLAEKRRLVLLDVTTLLKFQNARVLLIGFVFFLISDFFTSPSCAIRVFILLVLTICIR